MIPSLLRGRIPKAEEPQLARQLRIAPWCWPPDEHSRFEFAKEVSGFGGPAGLDDGVALGVTVWQEKVATLWRMELAEGLQPDASLGPLARQSWEDAACAVPRSVPVLWESVRAATQRIPTVRRIESYVHAGTALVESTVEGTSFGLTFGLLLASRIFHLPLPHDLAASAALDANGHIDRVEGIDLKVRCLLELAPRIGRLLVAEGQRELADTAAGGEIDVIGVRTLGQALRTVFGSQLEDALVSAGADAATRKELTRAFLRLSVASREAAIDWKPIEHAAKRAREEWPPLGNVERYTLEFTTAVAARHDRNAGDLSEPSEAWLSAHTLPVRLQIAAHLVQQAADAAKPTLDIAAKWVSRYASCEPREAFPHQLRLLGAEARLWAVTGRPVEALRRQEEVARTWWDAFDAAPISFSLTEWYRLSGACEDRASFGRAEIFRSELLRAADLVGDSRAYVQLARCKAGLQLHTLSDDELLSDLKKLLDHRLPDHLHWSAHRWLVRLNRDSCRRDDAQKLIDALMASETSDAKTQRALAILDDSDLSPNWEQALTDLQSANPGPLANLLQAAERLVENPARYVATYFPY